MNETTRKYAKDTTKELESIIRNKEEEKHPEEKKELPYYDITDCPIKVNAYPKDVFEERTARVFDAFWTVLSKSFGPYGAPTIISRYPYYHVTKDGYTIGKNTVFGNESSMIDRIVSVLIMDICSRLNTVVGDGTTTAVMATNMIYKWYRAEKDSFSKKMILPRKIIEQFNYLASVIIENLSKEESVSIKDGSTEEISAMIRKVAYISSNGNKEITDMITDMYEKFECPKIIPLIAEDGITRPVFIEGYQLPVCLMDRLYVNSDDDRAIHNNVDVILFDHKIAIETYDTILKPLARECDARGRKLLCIAPSYDSRAIDGRIKIELNNEYKAKHDISLILTTVRTTTNLDRLMYADLAMLLNTSIISSEREREIHKLLSTPDVKFFQIFNLDKRGIEGISVARISSDGQNLTLTTDDGNGVPDELYPYDELREDYIQIGYCGRISAGMKESLFSEFRCDHDKYAATLRDAEVRLKEAVDKYAKLGSFNLEIVDTQKRLQSLKLTIAMIKVGGDSEVSVAFNKDTVDDTVKACESAFENGIIMGCNVSLLRVIDRLLESEWDDLSRTLLRVLFNGFKSVYRTVLSNAFDDRYIQIVDGEEPFRHTYELMQELFGKDVVGDGWILRDVIYDDTTPLEDGSYSLFDIIINYSIHTNQVFDLESMKFSKDIINSTETDKEVLIATSDLMSLLMTGNQLIVNN